VCLHGRAGGCDIAHARGAGVVGVACFLLEGSSRCKKGQSMASGCSAGAVADHAGTMTTVVEVGSKLEHARVAVLAATATAAECRARAGAVTGRRGDARVGVCW
jgi:hypothetical protein